MTPGRSPEMLKSSGNCLGVAADDTVRFKLRQFVGARAAADDTHVGDKTAPGEEGAETKLLTYVLTYFLRTRLLAY